MTKEIRAVWVPFTSSIIGANFETGAPTILSVDNPLKSYIVFIDLSTPLEHPKYDYAIRTDLGTQKTCVAKQIILEWLLLGNWST